MQAGDSANSLLYGDEATLCVPASADVFGWTAG